MKIEFSDALKNNYRVIKIEQIKNSDLFSFWINRKKTTIKILEEPDFTITREEFKKLIFFLEEFYLLK